MQITFVHNPSAGDRNADAAAIQRRIAAAGHSVAAVSCRDEDWCAQLAEPADLVVVTGGDGTIGRVAKQMADRGIPLAALAAGTANNIALTLGVDELSLEQQIAMWPAARRRKVDVVSAVGPWGTDWLIEGLGCGLFAWSIRHAEQSESEKRQLERQERLARSLRVLKERVGAFETTHIRATLDGRDISGDYIVFEAMNTRFVGPNLFLAPDANPGDGQLDVVFVRDDERDTLRDHLASWQRGAMQPPPLSAVRGRVLQLQWTGFDLHLDDLMWPPRDTEMSRRDTPIEVRVEGRSVEFLVP